MKTIYTSNYARKGGDPNAAAISKKPPEWYTGDHFKLLAPTWEMIMGHKDGMSDQEYSELYLELLHERGVEPDTLVEFLPDGTFLLCFEKPTDFCHRQVLAKWLNDNAEVNVIEWKNEKEVAQSNQEDLVDSLLGF